MPCNGTPPRVVRGGIAGSGSLPELKELPQSDRTPGSTVAAEVAQAAAGPVVAAASPVQQGCRADGGLAAAILSTAAGPPASPPVVRDEPPPAIPDHVEYGELLWEYPPLVGELVSKYPLTTIKQLAAAVNKAAAGSYAEQWLWSGWGVGPDQRDGDALQGLRAAAASQQRSTAPTSKECRVEDPKAATSGSVPQMPDWPPFLMQWVEEQRAHWPLSAAHAAQLFAGDPDCNNIVRWLQQGVPLLHPGHTVPEYDCANYQVQPSLAEYAAAAAAQELAEHHVAQPPPTVHSPWVHATASVPKGPAAAPTGARRIHDFARPSGVR